MNHPGDIDETVEAMRGRLVEDYGPQRIVRIPPDLGDPDNPAEIDLLIVKETSDDMEARREKVLGLLKSVDPSVTVDALILTPSEMERRVTLGDYLLAEILQYGQALHPREDD